VDKLISEIASLGVPGLIFIFLVAVSGYAGAAAITTALATLGGPFGMVGGVAVLLLLTKISKGIAKYGVDELAKGVIKKMLDEGKTKASIINEIDSFPLISEDLKAKLRKFVRDN
jgi:hypothetical protein